MEKYACQIIKWRDTHGQVYETKLEALYSSYKAKRHDLGMQCMLLTYRASKDNYDALKQHIDGLAEIHDAIVMERVAAEKRGEFVAMEKESEEDV
jgi:hypothetical protein